MISFWLKLVFLAGAVNAVVHLPLIENGPYRDLGKKYSLVTRGVIEALLNKARQRTENADTFLTPQCEADINATSNAASNFLPWAMAAIDSWGKPNSLMWEQDQYWEGSYDTCTENEARWAFGGPGVPVKYCAAEWTSDRVAQFTNGIMLDDGVGLCLPKSCNKQDIWEFFITGVFTQQIGAPTSFPYTQPENVTVYCPSTHEETVEKFKHDHSVIGALCVIGFFVLLLVVGTIYDIVVMYKSEKTYCKHSSEPGKVNGGYVSTAHDPITDHTQSGSVAEKTNNNRQPIKFCKILLAFSMRKNAPSILNFKQSRGSINCLHGIRFLTMGWILVGHTHALGILFVNPGPNVGAIGRLSFVTSTDHTVVNEKPITVETFFILSAFLTTLSFLSKLEKKKPNCEMMGRYFFHRFWRLTPVYMMVVMIFVTMVPYLWSGPFYRADQFTPVDKCKEYWWVHLLYLNNMPLGYNAVDGCMPWTWYLANDFQFYVFAPVVLFPIFYLPPLGLVLTALCAVGGLIGRGVLYQRRFVLQEVGFDDYQEIYIRPWARCTTYFMGIFLGYILHKTKFKIRMHKALVAIVWILAIGAISACFYSTIEKNKWSPQGLVAWETLQRPLFSLGVCWVILACSTGHGGFINRILSWEGWLPWARLSYTAYLIHPIIDIWNSGARTNQVYPSNWLFIYWSLATLILTLGFSFLASLIFKVPFGNLERLMFENVGRKTFKVNDDTEMGQYKKDSVPSHTNSSNLECIASDLRYE